MRDLELAEEFIPNGTLQHVQGFVGGFYGRPFSGDVGYVHEGHAHYIDHALELVMGTIRVRWHKPDGRSGVVVVEGPKVLGDLPMLVPILAGADHTIEVIEPAVWRCLFAEAEAEKIEEAEGAVPYNMERAHV